MQETELGTQLEQSVERRVRTLEADGDGTIVRLVHSGLASPEAADEHGRGWTHYLACLEVAAAGGDPGPDAFVEGGA